MLYLILVFIPVLESIMREKVALPTSVSSRLHIPEPKRKKHIYLTKCFTNCLVNATKLYMTPDVFMKYVLEQRETRWRLKTRVDDVKTLEVKMHESTYGNQQNVGKYNCQASNLLSKDLKPAEPSVVLLSSIIDKIVPF